MDTVTSSTRPLGVFRIRHEEFRQKPPVFVPLGADEQRDSDAEQDLSPPPGSSPFHGQFRGPSDPASLRCDMQ
ncbi:hypothetical protein GN956_G17673 [Arapaima gigas]